MAGRRGAVASAGSGPIFTGLIAGVEQRAAFSGFERSGQQGSALCIGTGSRSLGLR